MESIKDNVVKVAEAEMPIDEQLIIRKHRIEPAASGGDLSRICVVTGIHGDELEGQFVCYEIARRILREPELLCGIVDIYLTCTSEKSRNFSLGLAIGRLGSGQIKEMIKTKTVEGY